MKTRGVSLYIESVEESQSAFKRGRPCYLRRGLTSRAVTLGEIGQRKTDTLGPYSHVESKKGRTHRTGGRISARQEPGWGGGWAKGWNELIIHLNRLVLGCGFQHGDYSYRYRAAYVKVAERVGFKMFHHKEKFVTL